MKHNLLSDRQISEIEERLNSMQKLLMMDVAALIKEMRTYRELLKEIESEKTRISERERIELRSIDDDIAKDYHDVLTPKEIQSILGIGRRQTYELLNSGEIQVIRVGRSMRISKRVFLSWLKG